MKIYFASVSLLLALSTSALASHEDVIGDFIDRNANLFKAKIIESQSEGEIDPEIIETTITQVKRIIKHTMDSFLTNEHKELLKQELDQISLDSLYLPGEDNIPSIEPKPIPDTHAQLFQDSLHYGFKNITVPFKLPAECHHDLYYQTFRSYLPSFYQNFSDLFIAFFTGYFIPKKGDLSEFSQIDMGKIISKEIEEDENIALEKLDKYGEMLTDEGNIHVPYHMTHHFTQNFLATSPNIERSLPSMTPFNFAFGVIQDVLTLEKEENEKITTEMAKSFKETNESLQKFIQEMRELRIELQLNALDKEIEDLKHVLFRNDTFLDKKHNGLRYQLYVDLSDKEDAREAIKNSLIQ